MAEVLRKAMVYLGLVDDEFDDERYEDEYQLDEPESRYASAQHGGNAQHSTTSQHSAAAPARRTAYAPTEQSDGIGAIRTLAPRERSIHSEPQAGRPTLVRPVSVVASTPSTARVHVVEPTGFASAQEIGDKLREGTPVIMSLQKVEPELSRRLIDFCSGSTYAIDGRMEKVARNVFLLTPANVDVSAEERRRLQERGLYKA